MTYLKRAGFIAVLLLSAMGAPAFADKYECAVITEAEDVRRLCRPIADSDPCPSGAQCWSCSTQDFYSPCSVIVDNINSGVPSSGNGSGSGSGGSGGSGSSGGDSSGAASPGEAGGTESQDGDEESECVTCDLTPGDWQVWCLGAPESLARLQPKCGPHLFWEEEMLMWLAETYPQETCIIGVAGVGIVGKWTKGNFNRITGSAAIAVGAACTIWYLRD